MRDVREYWKEIRAAVAALPEFVWVAPAGGEARFATEVPAEVAARLLHAKTHRLATPGEVEAHLAREAAVERQARVELLSRKGTVVVNV